MNKYLILMINKSYFFEYIEDSNIFKIYDDSSTIKMYFRKIFSRLCKWMLPFYFGNWKDEIKKYENVILLDSGYNSFIAKYIKKRNPNINVIFYYWNVINENNKKILKDKNIDYFWTFDERDSKIYNIRYSPQFYNKCNISKCEKKFDVCFLGAAKNREKQIKEIKELLDKNNIKNNIIISYSGDKLMSYLEYLCMISESRAILDVIGDNQIGITLRCLEAINYEKKLITNNRDIVKYSFYNKNNVFIIGRDTPDKLNNFFELPYEKIEPDIINEYSYETWVNNLIEGVKK